MKADEWVQFSEGYDDKVFSLTKFPERRKQILDNVGSGRILILGAGSATYLNRDLIARGNSVVGSDFCQNMLDVASGDFSHPNLEYRLEDSTNLSFGDATFDGIVSTNSILPPDRGDVKLMAREIYRVLKEDGKLVAFLPAFDYGEDVAKKYGIEMDYEEKRKHDTTGWQCYHTFDTIREEFVSEGFREHEVSRVYCDTDLELSELKRLYGLDASDETVFEYFLVAKK